MKISNTKKLKEIFLFSIVLNISLINGVAQSNIFNLFKTSEDIGDEYFKKFSYLDALASYSIAIEESLDSNSTNLKFKIAETYRMLNDPENSSKWYEEGLLMDSINPIYSLHYAEALSSLKRYDEAKKWYKKFGDNVSADGRSVDKITRINTHEELFRDESNTTVNEVSFNSEYADFSPIIHAGDVYFVSSRPSEVKKVNTPMYNWDQSDFLDIYILDSNKSITKFNKEINTRYHEGPLTFYDEGRKMLFTRNNYKMGFLRKSDEGISKLKLYSSEQSTTSGRWSEPKELYFNNDEYSVGHPTISSDGRILYFISDMPNGHGGTDIYKSVYDSGNWQTPQLLGHNVNTEGNEMFPYLHNGRFLYFASNGHGGLGGLDLFVVDLEKGENAQVFNLGSPINSSFDDFGITLQPDGLSGYLSSNRKDSRQNDDIYSFITTIPFSNKFIIKGIVYNRLTKEVLPNAMIRIKLKNGSLKNIETDSVGFYSLDASPNEIYDINVSKNGFYDAHSTLTVKGNQTEYEEDFYLNEEYDFTLYGIIKDHKTDLPLDSVNILIHNKVQMNDADYVTTNDGDFEHEIKRVEMGDEVKFHLKFKKRGYLGKSIDYEAILNKPGRINLNESLNIKLDKITVGTDIGKLIDLNPIYFDLGKSFIRPDAAAELNKIVTIMKENPTMVIELGSHTDARGSAASNFSLSDRRAKSSAQYIVTQGIEPSRIIGKGYGEKEIINKCVDGVKCNEAEHQVNRRTEFKIVEF